MVKAAAIAGVFPTLINVPQKMLNVLTSSPTKLQAYLYNTSFSLAETPFAETILQQYAVKMDKQQVEERIRYKVFDCWSMMIVPVTAQNKVFGVLALANKVDHAEFTDEDLELAKNLSEMAGITINHILSFEDLQDKLLIDNQLQTAEIIQSHLLPENIHISDKYEFAVHYQPAYRLGGDYYDFIKVDETHIGVLVADVSGKGIPAGLVMATTRSLAAVLIPGELSPRDALIKLNNHLHRLIPENMFVTISYAILNTETGELVCARAGHEPLMCYFKQRGMCMLGSGKGMVVGMVDDEIFSRSLENESYQLESGDVVLFYTDGVTEAHNPDGEEFGRQRLGRILDTVKELDACNAMECLIHRINRFMEDEAPYDDISLVLIKAK
jgi:sigma-B regulation protein RsbU (phosphoserine phosphatase)